MSNTPHGFSTDGVRRIVKTVRDHERRAPGRSSPSPWRADAQPRVFARLMDELDPGFYQTKLVELDRTTLEWVDAVPLRDDVRAIELNRTEGLPTGDVGGIVVQIRVLPGVHTRAGEEIPYALHTFQAGTASNRAKPTALGQVEQCYEYDAETETALYRWQQPTAYAEPEEP